MPHTHYPEGSRYFSPQQTIAKEHQTDILIQSVHIVKELKIWLASLTHSASSAGCQEISPHLLAHVICREFTKLYLIKLKIRAKDGSIVSDDAAEYLTPNIEFFTFDWV